MLDISSVLIYLMTFFTSYLFLKIGEQYLYMNLLAVNTRVCAIHAGKIDKRKLLFLLYTVIGLIIPCFLAAVRDVSVGTDVYAAIASHFEMIHAKKMSFAYFFNNLRVDIEFLFALILFICAKIGTINIFFFVIQFLVVVPIYLTLYKFKDKLSPAYGMLIYYFLFYNFSLSGTRQSIAMSLVMLGWSFIEDRKIFKVIFFIFIAFLFHQSACVIAFVIAAFVFILNNNKKSSKVVNMTISAVLVIVFFMYRKIAALISLAVGVIKPRYSFYINKYLYNEFHWENIFLTDLIFKSSILIVLLIAIYISKIKLSRQEVQITWFSILGRYFILFSVNFYEASRIAYYFDFFLILLIPIIANLSFKRDKMNLFVTKSVLILPAIVYWLYFIMRGAYGTEIFKFYWQ